MDGRDSPASATSSMPNVLWTRPAIRRCRRRRTSMWSVRFSQQLRWRVIPDSLSRLPFTSSWHPAEPYASRDGRSRGWSAARHPSPPSPCSAECHRYRRYVCGNPLVSFFQSTLSSVKILPSRTRTTRSEIARNATNAGLLAVSMLSTTDERLAEALHDHFELLEQLWSIPAC